MTTLLRPLLQLRTLKPTKGIVMILKLSTVYCLNVYTGESHQEPLKISQLPRHSTIFRHINRTPGWRQLLCPKRIRTILTVNKSPNVSQLSMRYVRFAYQFSTESPAQILS